MKVGVIIPNFSALADLVMIVAVAQAAEELGFDSVWTTDHIMMPRGLDEPYGHIYEALITLAYIAGVTKRVELGTSVIVLPPRNPVLIAKETASLDALSSGRLIFGMGPAGWSASSASWARASTIAAPASRSTCSRFASTGPLRTRVSTASTSNSPTSTSRPGRPTGRSTDLDWRVESAGAPPCGDAR